MTRINSRKELSNQIMWNEKTISFAALFLSILALIGVVFWRVPRASVPEGAPLLSSPGEPTSPPESFMLEGEVVSWGAKSRLLSIRDNAGREYRVAIEAAKSIYTAQGLFKKTPLEFSWEGGMKVLVYTHEPIKGNKDQLSAASITIIK